MNAMPVKSHNRQGTYDYAYAYTYSAGDPPDIHTPKESK